MDLSNEITTPLSRRLLVAFGRSMVLNASILIITFMFQLRHEIYDFTHLAHYSLQ